jgi:hypothetical protein
MFTTSNTGSKWNMIKYFSEYSHGKLDLTGTQVFGWFKLNKSVADYNGPNGGRTELIKWARKAATDSGVDLSPFFSTIVCCNRWKDIGSVGSGVVSQGPLTLNPQLLGHEMGHVYGMNHSRIDGSTVDYMDPWDIMSAANVYTAYDAEYGPIGPGVNASNMRSRGWLDESRVWKANCNFDQEVKLRPLVRHDLNGFLAAEMPGGYLAEFRVREGWDGGIPRPAVLIHRFDGGNSYLMSGNSGSSGQPAKIRRKQRRHAGDRPADIGRDARLAIERRLSGGRREIWSKNVANGAKKAGSSNKAPTRANSTGNTSSSAGRIDSHNVG